VCGGGGESHILYLLGLASMSPSCWSSLSTAVRAVVNCQRISEMSVSHPTKWADVLRAEGPSDGLLKFVSFSLSSAGSRCIPLNHSQGEPVWQPQDKPHYRGKNQRSGDIWTRCPPSEPSRGSMANTLSTHLSRGWRLAPPEVQHHALGSLILPLEVARGWSLEVGEAHSAPRESSSWQ
jgi:hypothetical protein